MIPSNPILTGEAAAASSLGTDDHYRDVIDEALGLVAMHARIGQDFAAARIDNRLACEIRSAYRSRTHFGSPTMIGRRSSL